MNRETEPRCACSKDALRYGARMLYVVLLGEGGPFDGGTCHAVDTCEAGATQESSGPGLWR
jgi:hypothetical protein